MHRVATQSDARCQARLIASAGLLATDRRDPIDRPFERGDDADPGPFRVGDEIGIGEVEPMDLTAQRLTAEAVRLSPRPLEVLTSYRYAGRMATKKKVTLYVDEDVMRAARVRAARTDKRDSEVVEDALRAYLGFDVLADVWARSVLGEEEAMRLAVEETHAARAEKRAARGS